MVIFDHARERAEACAADLNAQPSGYQAERILAELAISALEERLSAARMMLAYSPKAAVLIARGAA